jgi:site-specific recombinase XerD
VRYDGEGISLTVKAMDSSRMVLHVRSGKGAKERYAPLPQASLTMLRQPWTTHRHPRPKGPRLFPGAPKAGQVWATVEKPLDESSVQKAMRRAVEASALQKEATIHTFRPSWATH